MWGLNTDLLNNKIDSSISFGKNENASFKPLIESHGIDLFNYIEYINTPDFPSIAKRDCFGKGTWLGRKLKRESLITLNDTASKFHLTIDPLLNFEFGRDVASADTVPENLYKNTRGVLVRGDIGKKFSFESSFQENQATFVKYVDDYIEGTNNLFPNSINYTYNIIPGQGRSKSFKKNGYDFGFASGYISYSPAKHFNLQIGHGKHFVGDGYRSLLLSDNAFNYPFARITSSFGKFQYTNLYTSFMNLTDGGVKTPPNTERLFQKKSASFQFLSWNINKRIQLGVFNGLIWQASDSMNNQCLRFSYFSPVIYTSALTEGLNGTNNVLLGATLKLKLTNSISLYGQFMLDDDGTAVHEKNGFQAGGKYFDAFGLRNLHLQLEYNQVSPYSYAATNPSQSYTHYNQPLAHPFGAWFKESIVFLNYRIRDLFTEMRFSYASVGSQNFNYNSGENIFLSDSSNLPPVIPSGTITPLLHLDFHVGYLINPSTNLNIVAGISSRISEYSGSIPQTNFVYFGIRTSLDNVYYDF